MNALKKVLMSFAILLLGFTTAHAAASFTVGTDDFYLSVGNYDYLPYAYSVEPRYRPPRISFYAVMNDYGTWVTLPPFGQVWQPYAAYGWRPYTYGHWSYTQYGPTWVGYEPWAWVGYHYGSWAYTPRFGWVWIPDYDWHPGRVAWAQSYDSIGWMPLPPSGYDYSRGYLAPVGPVNQFSYYDDDFGFGFYSDGYYNSGGPYYDPRYRNLYYNSAYLRTAPNLWIFLDVNYFGRDNYANYYLGDRYVRQAFDRRLIRVSSRPIERRVMERVVKQRVPVASVQVNEIEADSKRVKVVAIQGEQERIRKNANQVVTEVIAPAFAKKNKDFQGAHAKNPEVVNRIFAQEHKNPKTQTLSTTVVQERANRAKNNREHERQRVHNKQQEELKQVEKQGRIREKKGGPDSAPGQQKKQNKQKDNDRPSKSSHDSDSGSRLNQRSSTQSDKKQDMSHSRSHSQVQPSQQGQKSEDHRHKSNKDNVRQNESHVDENGPDSDKAQSTDAENASVKAQEQDKGKNDPKKQASDDKEKQSRSKKSDTKHAKKGKNKKNDKDNKHNDDDDDSRSP